MNTGEHSVRHSDAVTLLCISPGSEKDRELQENLLQEIMDYTHAAEAMENGDKTCYPGEQSAMTGALNLQKGIPVDTGIWEEILKLSE